MSAAAVQTVVFLREASIWRLRGNRRAFVKLCGSDDRHALNDQRATLVRERTCLEVLRGLAVPEVARLSTSERSLILGGRRADYLAQSVVGTLKIDNLGLSPRRQLGAWAFVAEQLVAFRRHQILYSDIKCINIIGRKSPLAVAIVDFGCAVPLIRGKLPNHGYTPIFAAPETGAKPTITEPELSYQLGMLLAHMMTQVDNTTLGDSRIGLARVVQKLSRIGAPSLGPLVRRCLDKRPERRPRNYERILAAVNATRLPQETTETWRQLRAPYAARLAEVAL